MSDIITKDLAKSVEDQVIAWRRELHQCPELGMKTVETEKIILRVLKEIGIEEVRSGIGGQDCHGVAAVIRGSPGNALESALTATPCPSWKRQACLLPQGIPAACMPAAMTGIRPWAWESQKSYSRTGTNSAVP